jgi:hypothetical protein
MTLDYASKISEIITMICAVIAMIRWNWFYIFIIPLMTIKSIYNFLKWADPIIQEEGLFNKTIWINWKGLWQRGLKKRIWNFLKKHNII